MPDPDKKHRANEAARLLREPLLAEALDTIRTEALFALEDADPTNPTIIRDYQAKARVAKEMKEFLEGVILQGGSKDGGIDPEGEPTDE